MKWSWKVARVAGVVLRVHATFFILLAWLAIIFYAQDGLTGAAVGVLFTLAIFASVVMHELGHVRVARRFGVPTRDITLLPIGGVARLERMPEDPRQELWIALAGPAVTVVIAGALYAGARLLGSPAASIMDAGASGDLSAGFVARLMWVNVWLLGFNLLPAFPMDGGRVLRALLAMRMSYQRATEIAARVARSFALVFGMVGLLVNPLLVIIALFVWLGAAGEAATVQLKASVTGVPVERVMIRDIATLRSRDTLDVALDHVLAGFQADFPVVERDRVVGMLTRAALLRGLAKHGRDGMVGEAMARTFRTADLHEPLEHAVGRLFEGTTQTLPVLDQGQLRGVLTADNVGEYLMIEAALRDAPPSPGLVAPDTSLAGGVRASRAVHETR